MGQFTACDAFVGEIRAVVDAVAELGAFDTFRSARRRTSRAEKLVIGTANERAITLVRIISAIRIAVATPPVRYAQTVVATELTAVARREICNHVMTTCELT